MIITKKIELLSKELNQSRKTQKMRKDKHDRELNNLDLTLQNCEKKCYLYESKLWEYCDSNVVMK